MNYDLLHELLRQLASFEDQRRAKTPPTLSAFVLWLNNQVLFQSAAPTDAGQEWEAVKAQHEGGNKLLAFLLLFLSKQFKTYTKKALTGSGMLNLEELISLALLTETPSLRKMELISRNYLETSAGVEIIKRLLKNGFIEEFDDPDDKRSKRVRITPAGTREYQQYLPRVDKAVELLGAGMPAAKKIQLINLLDELSTHHIPLYEEAKKLELDELLTKVQKTS